jgi:hypothetical protein
LIERPDTVPLFPSTINITINVNHIAPPVAAPYRPGPLYLFLRSERDSMAADVLTYDVLLPAPGTDVETRELSIDYGNDTHETRTLLKTAVTTQIKVDQDATVAIALVDIDDAHNRSEPSTFSFVATDTLPPATPGALGVVLVGEEDVPEAPTP